MSELTTAARPYAKAVFELATEDKTQKQWSDAVRLSAHRTKLPNR